MSDTEIKKGDTWVNKLDETNTVTIATVGAFSVTGSSIKDGNYMASRDDFLHYFKPQSKENVPMSDPINHPEHYTSHPSGIECIEVTRHMGFAAGNVIKYLWRNGLKDGEPSLKDLKKAAWYLNDMIDQLEAGNE
jgi:hypothetical protein